MCGNLVKCQVFSIGSIIQSCFHLIFVVYGYYMSICSARPKKASTMFFYLTYLYKRKCGQLSAEPSTEEEWWFPIEDFFTAIFKSVISNTDSENLTAIMEEVLNETVLPQESTSTERAHSYIFTFIMLEAVWMVTSVALLMGAVFKIRQTFSLIFYGPWLIMTGLISLFNVVAIVHFGMDIGRTTNFLEWAIFVGVENPSSVEDLDNRSPALLTIAPTVVMLLIFSRFGIFWIWNLAGLYFISRAAKAAYRETYKKNSTQNRNPDESENMNSSSARIRNWQLFYGAIGGNTNTTSSGSSGGSIRDINSNTSRIGKNVSIVQISDDSSQSNVIPGESQNGQQWSSQPAYEKECMVELRSQKPWSYFPDADGPSTSQGVQYSISQRNLRSVGQNSEFATESKRLPSFHSTSY